MDRETIQTLLDLLNPLHGSLDRQTYDERVKEGFDAPDNREYNVDITEQMERDLTQAVCILEDRLRMPCWDDGSCPTPVKCYLRGCQRESSGIGKLAMTSEGLPK